MGDPFLYADEGFRLPPRMIQLRGVAVHNLKRIDLDVPHRRLVVICGVSGSGKTSLALDTLYAEGQRRYIESFSAYTRQFLAQLDKPAADRLDGLPPAIAVRPHPPSRTSRATIGTATEIVDYLRLLYARVGRTFCQQCQREIRRDSPQSIADRLQQCPTGTRLMVAFPITATQGDVAESCGGLQREGLLRAIVDGRVVALADLASGKLSGNAADVVVDRLALNGTAPDRLRDSLETAMHLGGGRCTAYLDLPRDAHGATDGVPVTVDDAPWTRLGFSRALSCEDCGLSYPAPEPRLFNFNSPLGACPECEGFGKIVDIDMDLVVPDPTKTLRDGAIAPWNTPAYNHELEELLELAPDYDVPVDVPFQQLDERQRALIQNGVPERKFGGLRGFFAWIERRKYKMHLRVFLSRWRSAHTCPTCGGKRLRYEALATQVGGQNLADLCQMTIQESRAHLADRAWSDAERQVTRLVLDQILMRLGFLATVGLGYLSLDRTLRTLSTGEAQRVALTTALGSSLVDMLYVLDEPSAGLHPCDIQRLVAALQKLRDRGNTVVVVEHDESILRAADHVVEIGPGAGERGGEVVYAGPLAGMSEAPQSLTADYLWGRRGIAPPAARRPPRHGWVRLVGARGNNLHNITVDFPLGVLCLVTGVSGAGKSTLVQDTLYGALCRRKRKDAPKPLPFDDVFGDGQIDEVVLVDQAPIGRSPRSNPVTYVKAFDPIRAVFADTLDARTHNYQAGHFSFNSADGRCAACDGDGFTVVDMQFLPDVMMKCAQCHGRRYRQEILEITYRGKNIAQVLELTVREAFGFFRGQNKVLARLKFLIDVGLDYLRLGQPATTLSGGEAQRLKLATYLASARRHRTLFLLDEPTTGLHFADIATLLDCFEALLQIGHSLIVVEHNLQLMKAADWIIDMGPEAGAGGGRIVGAGTPEELARTPLSHTGQLLADTLRQGAA